MLIMMDELGTGRLAGRLYHQVVSIRDFNIRTYRGVVMIGVHVTCPSWVLQHRIRRTGHAGPQLMTELNQKRQLRAHCRPEHSTHRAKSISARWIPDVQVARSHRASRLASLPCLVFPAVVNIWPVLFLSFQLSTVQHFLPQLCRPHPPLVAVALPACMRHGSTNFLETTHRQPDNPTTTATTKDTHAQNQHTPQ